MASNTYTQNTHTHTGIYTCRHTYLIELTRKWGFMCTHTHTQTHTDTLGCLTNDSALIAERVYLLATVIDGPLLPGSQSEGDGKNASGLAGLDMLFDILTRPPPPLASPTPQPSPRNHVHNTQVQTLSLNTHNLSLLGLDCAKSTGHHARNP